VVVGGLINSSFIQRAGKIIQSKNNKSKICYSESILFKEVSYMNNKNDLSSQPSSVRADEIWEFAWTYIRTVVDTLREPFLVLNDKLEILSANKTFYAVFQVVPEETEGSLVYELGNGQWNIPKLKVLLEDILPKNTYFEDFRVEHDFPKIGHKIMMLNARQVHEVATKDQIILLAMEDITKQVQLEDQLRDYAKKLTTEVAEKTAELEVRVQELERMNEMMVGREVKMTELKQELEKFKKKQN
jgi:chemotaxis protein methyltransferase CheR